MATLKTSKSNTKKTYYPLFFDIGEKLCIVIGGGTVAERKVLTLLRCSAAVKLISPKMTKKLTELWERNLITVIKRRYTPGDLAGASLVIAATDDIEINLSVREESLQEKILVNVVDQPDLCDFIVPSIVRRGPLTIAVSTAGTAPAVAKMIREDLDTVIDKNYIRYASVLGDFRKYLMEAVKDKGKRSTIMNRVRNIEKSELLRLGLKGLKRQYIPVSNE